MKREEWVLLGVSLSLAAVGGAALYGWRGAVAAVCWCLLIR